MFRFLLFAALLALARCEGVGFFQGEWKLVATFASDKGMVELMCDALTFQVINEHKTNNVFNISMKANNKVVIEEDLAKVVNTKQEVETILKDGCGDGKHSHFFTVHRDLTENYRMMYVKNCRDGELWNLLAKEAPTHAALEQFVNSNEELKDKYRAFLCTSEEMQNPRPRPTFVPISKAEN